MRAAIRTQLISKVTAVGGRVYEPYIAGATTQKPYIVVKFAGEKETKMRRGFDLPYEVWLYDVKTTMKNLDSMQASVVNALSEVVLTTAGGKKFELQYAGCGEDFLDPDLESYTRRLDFKTVTIRGG